MRRNHAASAWSPRLLRKQKHRTGTTSRKIGNKSLTSTTSFKVSERHLTLAVTILSALYLLSLTIGPMLMKKSSQFKPLMMPQSHVHHLGPHLRLGKNYDIGADAAPPPFVEFDLRGDSEHAEDAATAVDYFLQNCMGNTVKEDSPKYSHLWNGIEFLKDPECAEVAKHPVILEAVRKVMGLGQDSPLYLFGVRHLKKTGVSHIMCIDHVVFFILSAQIL